MNIFIAKHSGFCFGVDRAIKNALAEREKNTGRIFTLGEIIHNDQVIKMLRNKGIEKIDDLNQVCKGDTLIIRSHGESKKIINSIIDKDIKLVDTTCPYVKKVHKIVETNCDKFDKIIIIGDKNHPEIIGVKGWCENNSIVVSTLEEANEISNLNVCVVAQTTLKHETFITIVNNLNERNQVTAFNTICSATSERQDSIRELASHVDAMIIVGGKKSSNTKKLYEISKNICKKTYLIETSEEIMLKDFAKCVNIGIAGGASTPHWIINEIVDKFKNEGEVLIYGEN